MDSIRTKRNQEKISNFLLVLWNSADEKILIFSSPEFLLLDPWKTTTQSLMRHDMLRLIFTDEVRQFVMFRCTFRPEFTLLKESLFQCLHFIHLWNMLDNNCHDFVFVPTLLQEFTLGIYSLHQRHQHCCIMIHHLMANYVFWIEMMERNPT